MTKKQYHQLGGEDDDDIENNIDNSNNELNDNEINNNNNNNNEANNEEVGEDSEDTNSSISSPINILTSIRSPELYYAPPQKKLTIDGQLATSPSLLSQSLTNSGTSPLNNSLNNSKMNTPKLISTSSNNNILKNSYQSQNTPINSNTNSPIFLSMNNGASSNNNTPPLNLEQDGSGNNFDDIDVFEVNDPNHIELKVMKENHIKANEDDYDKINFMNTIRQIRTFRFEKKHKKKLQHYLLGLLPIISWLPSYNWKNDWKGDFIAGITVGVMLIPQGMAYAMVAGLPPIYGLYSSILPVLAYCIFGTSKQLSMGPFAIISLLVSETVNSVAGPYRPEDPHFDMYHRVSVAILLSLVCGVMQMFLGLIRFGFVANFLSDPVRTGFTSGCALIIGSSQLKHIFGYGVEDSNFLLLLVFRYLKAITNINGWSFLIGIIGIVILIGIKKANTKWRLKIPGPLCVVVIFTFISWVIKLEQRAHIKVVGDIPSGFPMPEFPLVRYNHSLYYDGTPATEGFPMPPETNWIKIVINLIPGALVLVLVGFISSISIGSKFGEKYNYPVDPNQELFALGASDFVGSFFLSFPVGASLSRTAVNAQNGAVSQISSFISTIIIIISIFFLTPIVYFLPRAILSSIVIVAIIDLVEYQIVFDLWKVHRKDLLLFSISFLSTTCLGILQGILIGTITSLLMIIYRSAYPPFAVLGRLPNTEIYKNIKRVPKAETFKGIRIVRIDGSIYFANCMFIKKKLRHHEPFHRKGVDEESISIMTDSEAENANIDDDEPIEVIIDGHPTIGAIIIDFSSVNDIDSTGIRMLKELVNDFRKRQLVIYFASVKGYVRDSMKRGGVVDHYGAEHFFWTINDAVEHHLFLLRQSRRQNSLNKSSKNIFSKSSSSSIQQQNQNSNNNSIITTSPFENNNSDNIPLIKQ